MKGFYSLILLLFLLVLTSCADHQAVVEENQPGCKPFEESFCSDTKTLVKEARLENCTTTTSEAVCDYSCKEGKCVSAPAPAMVSSLPDTKSIAANYADVEYAKVGNVSLRLDIYLPDSGKTPVPVIVFIHGGGWMSGDKSDCSGDISGLSQLGFAVVCVNYRLSDVAKFPAQIHDVKSSIRWIRANADKYGFDKEHIGAMGISAGGHLTALLGTSGDVSELEGTVGVTGYSSRIEAAYDLFGPTDFIKAGIADITDKGAPFYDYLAAAEALLGGPLSLNKENAESANPIKYVTSDDPPFDIVHGKKDTTVPYNQSVLLEQALKQAGVPVTLKLVEDGGHAPSIVSIESTAMEFFGKYLKD